MRTCLLSLLIAAAALGCAKQPRAVGQSGRRPAAANKNLGERQPSSSLSPAMPGARSNADERSPFAVVELFTSEGCSSCPPADRLLAEIEADARAHNRNIYVLSFHVDYWNYLGWRDPFSDAAYSKR